MLICGRWELATATGRGEARAGAAGSVGTVNEVEVHGGAGGAATMQHQARGAATSKGRTQPSRDSGLLLCEVASSRVVPAEKTVRRS